MQLVSPFSFYLFTGFEHVGVLSIMRTRKKVRLNGGYWPRCCCCCCCCRCCCCCCCCCCLFSHFRVGAGDVISAIGAPPLDALLRTNSYSNEIRPLRFVSVRI